MYWPPTVPKWTYQVHLQRCQQREGAPFQGAATGPGACLITDTCNPQHTPATTTHPQKAATKTLAFRLHQHTTTHPVVSSREAQKPKRLQREEPSLSIHPTAAPPPLGHRPILGQQLPGSVGSPVRDIISKVIANFSSLH